MSISLNEVHSRIQEKKRKRKDLGDMTKDQLSVHPRYNEILDEMARLREEKKAIEKQLRGPADIQELEAIKSDIRSDLEMLADIALNMYIANETVEIVDDMNARWVPVFAVRFKRD